MVESSSSDTEASWLKYKLVTAIDNRIMYWMCIVYRDNTVDT